MLENISVADSDSVEINFGNISIERKKFALVHIGNDESYGLVFVAGELKSNKHDIKWFDGDLDNVANQIIEWSPDFIFFSPMTSFYNQAKSISNSVKEYLSSVCSVFGGHHVYADRDAINDVAVDVIVIGPINGTINKIINSKPNSFIDGVPFDPNNMPYSRSEYYEAIPRIANRHRKYLMSHFGCVYNCSYCAAGLMRKTIGAKAYKKSWLTRRPVEHVIDEARELVRYGTKEIALEDDDVLVGEEAPEWLNDFAIAWKEEVNLPMYANVTPNTVVKVTDETLKTLSELVTTVTMGVQTSKPESLRLFNRQFQKEDQVKEAYERLNKFGIKVKIELIIGLPVEDPIDDAIETIKLAQRVAAGGFVACFPLMLYPGTALWNECLEMENIELNDACSFEWHTGEGSIKFDPITAKKLKNMTKMVTMFVKYNVSEFWMRAFINMDLTNEASKQLSECQYMESLVFRNGKITDDEFEEIISGMNFKY